MLGYEYKTADALEYERSQQKEGQICTSEREEHITGSEPALTAILRITVPTRTLLYMRLCLLYGFVLRRRSTPICAGVPHLPPRVHRGAACAVTAAGFPPLFEVPVSARHTITTHSPLLTCYEPRSNCLFLVRSGSIPIMAGRFVRSSKYRTCLTAIPRSYRALTCFSRPRIWTRYA